MTRPFYAEHIENDADYAWIVENPVYAWSRYGESGDPRDLAMMFAVLAEAKLSEEDGYGLFYRNDGHGGGYVSQYVEENRDAVNGVFAMMLTDPRYSNQAFKAVAGSYVRNGPKRIYNHVMPGYAVDALLTRTAQLTTEDFKNADAMTHAAFIAGVIHAAEESARLFAPTEYASVKARCLVLAEKAILLCPEVFGGGGAHFFNLVASDRQIAARQPVLRDMFAANRAVRRKETDAEYAAWVRKSLPRLQMALG